MGTPDLLTAVDAIYASALDPERWPEALDTIAQLVGGLGAVIVPITTADKMATVASTSLDESNRDYSREWWQYDIRKEKVSARGPTDGLIKDADLLDDETLRTHPFCQEFSRRHGLGAYMGSVTALPSGQIITVGVHRDLRRGPFEKADEDNYARLAPHAARAIAAAAEIAEGRRTSRLLGNTLDRLTCGIILLNAQGGVVTVSETARSLLGTGFTVSRGRLKAATAKDQKALDALVMSALPGRATLMQSPLVLARNVGDKQKVFVQAIPVTGNEPTTFEHLALRPGVLVLVNGLFHPSLGYSPGTPDPAQPHQRAGPYRDGGRQWAIVKGSGSAVETDRRNDPYGAESRVRAPWYHPPESACSTRHETGGAARAELTPKTAVDQPATDSGFLLRRRYHRCGMRLHSEPDKIENWPWGKDVRVPPSRDLLRS
ncbi:hypothetical protein [Microvirga tunisiensis]|uniref:hypothetical protein n=1 Tax=Microvirga tunisiensis TaxID=2108360 RepID=UPI001FCED152|nr:hypothetical protein [Microvirga tunisiensis]